MNSPPRRIAILVSGAFLLAALVLGVSMLVIFGNYPTEQTATISFPLPDDFTHVRKTLVRTGATKRIITMAGDNAFLDQSWTSVGGGLDSLRLLKAWHLELHGTMKVQSQDPYVGKPIVELTQDIHITADEVVSQVKMIRPDERLLDYRMTTHFRRDEEHLNTQVELKLTQKILTRAPWFAHSVADRRVYESAEKALLNQKEAIIDLFKAKE